MEGLGAGIAVVGLTLVIPGASVVVLGLLSRVPNATAAIVIQALSRSRTRNRR